MKTLINLISKFDNLTLNRIVGSGVANAIRSEGYELSSALAKIIVLKYGYSILEEREIRDNLLDTASEEDIFVLASNFGLNETSWLQAVTACQKHLSTYSIAKSKLFVDWLQLGPEYYKKNQKDYRLEVDQISISHGQKTELKGYLHPYQKNIKDQISSQLNRVNSRAMVQMPTGSGKTYTALEAMVDSLRKPFHQSFIVWLVNSNELAEQALVSFSELWRHKGDRDINIFRLFHKFFPKFEKNSNGGVVFATYDIFESALASNKLERIESLDFLANNTELTVIDEAHGAVAETYEQVIQYLVKSDKVRLLGLSATPFREDDAVEQQLLNLFSGNLVRIRNKKNEEVHDPVGYLQDQEYLAKIVVETLDSNVTCNDESEKSMLASLASDPARNEMIIDQIKHAVSQGDQTLVFACTLDHVYSLFILCEEAKIKADFIVGNVPQLQRLEILSKFKQGELNVLINLDILSTGIDIPSLDRLILTRPMKSAIQYSQIVGRALRGPKNGGNSLNTIVNVQDNLEHFPDIASLFKSFSSAWETRNEYSIL